MPISVPTDREASTSAATGEPPKKPGVFLTAEWLNLVMLNYAVDPGLLNRFVPSGTELDAFGGQTYVSLIGFEFNRTHLAGIAVPFHGSFEEVNLRFYVRRETISGFRRSVVFLRELVPKQAVAALARIAFGENYRCVPMSHSVRENADTGMIAAGYSWGSGASLCTMRIEAKGEASLPAEGSLSQFITEHYWGYAAQRNGGCLQYEVQHPRWIVREAESSGFAGDATRYYGPEFASVLRHPPDSAFFATALP
jgi:uncharacterized protein